MPRSAADVPARFSPSARQRCRMASCAKRHDQSPLSRDRGWRSPSARASPPYGTERNQWFPSVTSFPFVACRSQRRHAVFLGWRSPSARASLLTRVMANRLTKIYTRTGDKGTTGLADGSRVPKDHARIEAIGAIDELNSAMGVLLAEDMPAALRARLAAIQHDLFDIGGELSVPGHTLVGAAHVERLERE